MFSISIVEHVLNFQNSTLSTHSFVAPNMSFFCRPRFLFQILQFSSLGAIHCMTRINVQTLQLLQPKGNTNPYDYSIIKLNKFTTTIFERDFGFNARIELEIPPSSLTLSKMSEMQAGGFVTTVQFINKPHLIMVRPGAIKYQFDPILNCGSFNLVIETFRQV